MVETFEREPVQRFYHAVLLLVFCRVRMSKTSGIVRDGELTERWSQGKAETYLRHKSLTPLQKPRLILTCGFTWLN